ncbi:hypothetical protein [Rhodopirellula halodulae]|uniref:hypothetical protein n=1 Tax=Rhodopirellula halodulae TaxID=2894198 RepID=UPI001E5CD29B|nr:hypothetical protein [Rhodopirellula sp. JC737]MCC9655115.1 hypothetical protein [Rhodopirellula sp. JC737]
MSDWTIANQADLERWTNIRTDSRREVLRAITFGLIYLLAALAVGAYLLISVEAITDGTIIFVGWDVVEVSFPWMNVLAWIYAGLAVSFILLFVVFQLSLRHRLPATLVRLVAICPILGRVQQTLASAETLQSVYHAVLAEQPYGDAFQTAADEIQSPLWKRWASSVSTRFQAGQTIEKAMRQVPLIDHPIAAVITLGQDTLTHAETVRLWHQATEECHALLQSRTRRSIRFISHTGVIIATLLAGMAILSSNTYLVQMMEGLT